MFFRVSFFNIMRHRYYNVDYKSYYVYSWMIDLHIFGERLYVFAFVYEITEKGKKEFSLPSMYAEMILKMKFPHLSNILKLLSYEGHLLRGVNENGYDVYVINPKYVKLYKNGNYDLY